MNHSKALPSLQKHQVVTFRWIPKIKPENLKKVLATKIINFKPKIG